MQLYLIRHAEAQAHDPNRLDERRALTDKGKKQFERVVSGMQRLEIGFDRLLHSPMLRAVETAELLVPLLAGESAVEPELAREPRAELLTRLAQRSHASNREGGASDDERVALVGHEPWLSDLALWLVLGWRVYESGERPAPFDFEKGMLLVLSGDARPGAMRLGAMLPPRVLRKLAKD